MEFRIKEWLNRVSELNARMGEWFCLSLVNSDVR